MKHFLVFVLSLALLGAGCGYTQKTVLPRDIKTIYVETVTNGIQIGQVYAYQPGVEIKITNAIVKRLNQDGNLKVVGSRDQADAILEAELSRYEQEGVRFNALERVEEFRLFIVLNMRLIDNKTHSPIWAEPNFSGDSEYYVSEIRSIGREEAAEIAVDRLAKNVVDRIVEEW